jgi:hypothetical protein
MDVVSIVKRFGGQSALARLLGIRQSAVAYWVKKSNIPAKWHRRLLEVAAREGVVLNPQELSEIPISAPAIEPHLSVELPPQTARSAPAEPASIPAIISENREPAEFLFYAAGDGTVKVQVLLGNETVWASQRGMAEIFGVDVTTVNFHIKNIYQSEELTAKATIGVFPIVQSEGGRTVTRSVEFYNLDAIISVGYRVNSFQATQFRRWATSVLRDYLIKGFALDDDRLKQGAQYFGKDYFDELLDRIREIRASERRFYQKVTDLYAQCSVDYDPKSPITLNFYAHVQDKLHYAIHGNTSAELVYKRVDAAKPNMGLHSFRNQRVRGKVLKGDVTVGKNYLTEQEMSDLNRLVSMYLDFAENMARRKRPMTMAEWSAKLDDFLRFNAYSVLDNFGKTSRDAAEQRAHVEFEKFRQLQDKRFTSDFDKVVEAIQTKGKVPKSEAIVS